MSKPENTGLGRACERCHRLAYRDRVAMGRSSLRQPRNARTPECCAFRWHHPSLAGVAVRARRLSTHAFVLMQLEVVHNDSKDTPVRTSPSPITNRAEIRNAHSTQPTSAEWQDGRIPASKKNRHAADAIWTFTSGIGTASISDTSIYSQSTDTSLSLW